MTIGLTEGQKIDYARTCADAYISQYVTGDGVMNLPAIDYDVATGDFSWGSSLTPAGETEYRLHEIEDGCYGDTSDVSPDELRAAIVAFILDEADTDWSSLMDGIPVDADTEDDEDDA